ncbi:MAG: hypothetical protein IKF17_01895 [Clostridia bacterium]|nr:hypothetical protein [Clostridia bacterium]
MMDFSKMTMTHQKIAENMYRLRVGNDYIEVYTNFGYMQFPAQLDIIFHRHYIGTSDNLPTNPNRTRVLLAEVRNYFSKLFMKEMEEDIKTLASLDQTDELQKDFYGKRFNFRKGTSAKDVFKEVEIAYMAYSSQFAILSKDFYDIIIELSHNPDGFLSEAIQESLSWV